MSDNYDLIVVGFGGVGSAALYHASKKGWSALGLDQFGPSHNRGSSHGQTRIIRKAYFEHPNYVPLAEEAFQRWDELNKRHRTRPDIKPLFEQTGVLQIGKPDSEVIEGVKRSAEEHELCIETTSPEKISERLPILKIDDSHIGLFEKEAGFLRVEQCIAAHLAQAKKRGATIVSDTHVHDWTASDDGVVVATSQGTFHGKRLVLSVGAWASTLLKIEGIELSVIPKQQNWYQIDRVEQKLVNNFPVVFIEQNDGQQFYCLPELDSLGMKVARHTGGEFVTDVNQLSRDVDPEELERVEEFMKNHFHHTKRRLVHHSLCMYTMSSDGHFILDRHPKYANVVFAAGLSGHGFKFTPVLGNRLVEMLDGSFDESLQFLSLKRFGDSVCTTD